MYGLKSVATFVIAFIFTSGFAGGDSKSIKARYSGNNYTTSSELISSPLYDKESLKIIEEEKTVDIENLSTKKNIEKISESIKYGDKVDRFHRQKNYGQVMSETEDDDEPKEEKMTNIESRLREMTKIGSDLESSKYIDKFDSFYRQKNYGQVMSETEDDDDEPKEEKMTNIESRLREMTKIGSDLESSKYIDKFDSFYRQKNDGQVMSETEDDDEPKEEKMSNIESRLSKMTKIGSDLESSKYIDKVDSFYRQKNDGQVMSETEDDDDQPKVEKKINMESGSSKTTKMGSALKSSKYIDKVDSFYHPKNYGQAMPRAEDDDDQPKEEKMINIENPVSNTTETENVTQSSKYMENVDGFHRPKNYGQAMSEIANDDDQPKEEKKINMEKRMSNTTEIESALQFTKYMENIDTFHHPKNDGQVMPEAEDNDDHPKEEKKINIEKRISNTTEIESALQSPKYMENIDTFHHPKNDGQVMPEAEDNDDHPKEEKKINIEKRISNTTEIESALQFPKYMENIDTFHQPKNYDEAMSEIENDDDQPKEEKKINMEKRINNTTEIESALQSPKYMENIDSFHRPKSYGQLMLEIENDDDQPKEEKKINMEKRISNTTETEISLQSTKYMENIDSFHRPKNYGQPMSEIENDDDQPKEEKKINMEKRISNTTEIESALQSPKYMKNIDSFHRPKNYGQAMSEAKNYGDEPKEEKMINIESNVTKTTKTKSALQSPKHNNDNVDSFHPLEIDDDEVDDDEPNILCPEMRSGISDLTSEKPEEIVEDTLDTNDEENETLPNEQDKIKEDSKEDDKWKKNPKEDEEESEWEENPKEDEEESAWEEKPEEDKWDESPKEDNWDGNSEEGKVNGNQEEEKVNENQEEEKVEQKIELEENKMKPSEHGLSSCLGFGDDLVIKILFNGATDCEKSEDVVVPFKSVYSTKNDDYDYTPAFLPGILVDHNDNDFKSSEESHDLQEDNSKNYDYDYFVGIPATNES